MSELAVRTENLVRTFRDGEVKALDGVSLEVPAGQVFGLLGPNGSGKTTIIRILSTVLRATSGRAVVMGVDVDEHPERVRQLIGLAGQFAAVDPNLSGFENLRMMGRLNHLSRSVTIKRSTELLEQFGLAEAAHRPVSTYSGGMRRRLDLGASLVADPPLLFLDEPTTGLDPQSRLDLWKVIEELVAKGTSVLLTTQYLEEADHLASQLVVLDHGRVIASGTPAELKAQLGTTVLALTFASAVETQGALSLVRDLSLIPAMTDATSIELTVNSGPASAAEALRRLESANIVLAGLALREPSLDDVFLTLTGHRTEGSEPAADTGSSRKERS